MEISDFFSPVNLCEFNGGTPYPKNSLGASFKIFSNEKDFPILENAKIALIGVEDDRKAINNEGCGLAANHIREYLYKLSDHKFDLMVIDLGNIRAGHKVE